MSTEIQTFSLSLSLSLSDSPSPSHFMPFSLISYLSISVLVFLSLDPSFSLTLFPSMWLSLSLPLIHSPWHHTSYHTHSTLNLLVLTTGPYLLVWVELYNFLTASHLADRFEVFEIHKRLQKTLFHAIKKMKIWIHVLICLILFWVYIKFVNTFPSSVWIFFENLIHSYLSGWNSSSSCFPCCLLMVRWWTENP